MSLSQEIKRKALELGFDLIGITDASPLKTEQVEMFTDWLKSGYAGQMSYLHRNFEKRTQPAKLLANAQSIICVGLNYKPPKHPLSSQAQQSTPPQSFRAQKAFSPERSRRGSGAEESIKKSILSSLRVRHRRTRQSHLPHATVPIGKVANYAQYEDYHPFIKKRLRKLSDFISSVTSRDHKSKICVDSAPLPERALAARAGLGFIGKNRMLINPKLGPQIFLGEIITTLKLPTDAPITDNCSNCDKCISACPTGALMPDGQFDANKCINYLTIEYKGRIPPGLAEKIADRLFGCDDCVLACPYQKDAPVCSNKQFKFYSNRAKLDLSWILNLTQQDFENDFADSTIIRTGLDRLKRNARICLDNINRLI